jgi:hypothetical protein
MEHCAHLASPKVPLSNSVDMLYDLHQVHCHLNYPLPSDALRPGNERNLSQSTHLASFRVCMVRTRVRTIVAVNVVELGGK